MIVATENDDGRKLLRRQFNKDFSFFYVELPNGSILSHVVEENERFPAQFGREVRLLTTHIGLNMHVILSLASALDGI